MSLFTKTSLPENGGNTTTIISQGCQLNGELNLNCNIQIDGLLNGDIHTERTVIVTQTGQVKGDIYADCIIIRGLAEGHFYANHIEILQSGQAYGIVRCDDLSIEKGGRFVGETHLSNQKDIAVLQAPLRQGSAS
ncbi:polymer-forming cytoskeletal protein [Chromatiaceae bacterium AAb-1]|jgi:cytoskeletal protein CcmA (bactofilin family)|nr:polymer-forming cytoskeletal protein [Chromatiaceae bacterium AAb-1]